VPGNHESAGKRRSGRTGKGSKWLRLALKDAAMSAANTKGSYLQAQYRRLKPRVGTAAPSLAKRGGSLLADPLKVVVESETAPRESFRYRVSLSNWQSTRQQARRHQPCFGPKSEGRVAMPKRCETRSF
jgi:hypothetical protein